MKRGRIGRPRKYETDVSFRRAVEGYFGSISREVEVKDRVTGEVIRNDAGEPVKYLQYIVPPSMSALRLYLGITKKTWSNYANSEDGEYAWVCERAKGLIEAYLEEQLLTREKGIQGLIFNLSSNFSWKDRREIEIGSETRRTMAAASMTMEEKMELIRQMAAASEALEDGSGEDRRGGGGGRMVQGSEKNVE